MASFGGFHPISGVTSFHQTPLVHAPGDQLGSHTGFGWNTPSAQSVPFNTPGGISGWDTVYELNTGSTEANGMNTNAIMAAWLPGQTAESVKNWRWTGDLLFQKLKQERNLNAFGGDSLMAENEHYVVSLSHLNRLCSSKDYKPVYDKFKYGSEIAEIWKFIGAAAPGELGGANPDMVVYYPQRQALMPCIWVHADMGHHLWIIIRKVKQNDLENDYTKNETKIMYGPDRRPLPHTTMSKPRASGTPDPTTAGSLKYLQSALTTAGGDANVMKSLREFAGNNRVQPDDIKRAPAVPPVPPTATPAPSLSSSSSSSSPWSSPPVGSRPDAWSWQLVPWSSPTELPPPPHEMNGGDWFGHAIHIGVLQHFSAAPINPLAHSGLVDSFIFPRDDEFREAIKRIPECCVMINTH